MRPVTIRGRGGGSFTKLLPSRAYEEYEAACLRQLPYVGAPIDRPVNVKCVYWMRTRRRVDLVNLLEATMDILVRAGVLADDNSSIVTGHDGSRVRWDRERPRVEIEITENGHGGEKP
ncbi:MAG: RusA family crossover junction endodeoxyribonuclease [Clostridia bacterium]|nr:RusA family crossover junction endodeoxyribonuclease [Clostridia bacterium]